jgi:hypothetical protein
MEDQSGIMLDAFRTKFGEPLLEHSHWTIYVATCPPFFAHRIAKHGECLWPVSKAEKSAGAARLFGMMRYGFLSLVAKCLAKVTLGRRAAATGRLGCS